MLIQPGRSKSETRDHMPENGWRGQVIKVRFVPLNCLKTPPVHDAQNTRCVALNALTDASPRFSAQFAVFPPKAAQLSQKAISFRQSRFQQRLDICVPAVLGAVKLRLGPLANGEIRAIPQQKRRMFARCRLVSDLHVNDDKVDQSEPLDLCAILAKRRYGLLVPPPPTAGQNRKPQGNTADASGTAASPFRRFGRPGPLHR